MSSISSATCSMSASTKQPRRNSSLVRLVHSRKSRSYKAAKAVFRSMLYPRSHALGGRGLRKARGVDGGVGLDIGQFDGGLAVGPGDGPLEGDLYAGYVAVVGIIDLGRIYAHDGIREPHGPHEQAVFFVEEELHPHAGRRRALNGYNVAAVDAGGGKARAPVGQGLPDPGRKHQLGIEAEAVEVRPG